MRFIKSSLLSCGLILMSSASFAASFDCAKATTATEKLICGDENLSALDSQLATAYRQALEASSNKEAFKQE